LTQTRHVIICQCTEILRTVRNLKYHEWYQHYDHLFPHFFSKSTWTTIAHLGNFHKFSQIWGNSPYAPQQKPRQLSAWYSRKPEKWWPGPLEFGRFECICQWKTKNYRILFTSYNKKCLIFARGDFWNFPKFEENLRIHWHKDSRGRRC